MGNVCPWCCKNQDDSQSNDHAVDGSAFNNSQRSLTSSEVNDRTPLLSKSGNNQYHPVTPLVINMPNNSDSSSFMPTAVPPPPIVRDDPQSAAIKSKGSPNETTESTMATIVEHMLPHLIDVGGWGNAGNLTSTSTTTSTHSNHIRQLLDKSPSSTSSRSSISLPEVGSSGLSTLLSARPVSSEICHFVAHTAGELSRLLVDEIRIVHKEDLVVIFE